jgi:5-methylthioadenosine/S-adenosylhomocysteine deaminase
MQPKEAIDLLIAARWVLPISPLDAVLSDHALAISAGRIVGLGPRAQIESQYAPRESVVRDNHVLLPGFINAHTHAAMVLLRGFPVRAPLMRWLRETIWPLEQRWIGPDFVRDGTRLAIAEMLRAGITCFADMYLFPDEAARVATETRVRAVIGLPIIDAPSAWAQDATGYLDKGEQVWDEYRADPWVSLYFAPHAPYSVSDSTLSHLRRTADELDARIAMHVHETRAEIEQSLALYQRRPLHRLDDLGLLRPGFTAVHMNHLTREDLALAERKGIAVVACPQSNLRLGSGFASLPELIARKIPIGLGTDGAASTGALDMLAEARVAALLANGVAGEEPGSAGVQGGPRSEVRACTLSANEALCAATLGSAAALGLASSLGTLEPGKAADLVCIDVGSLACQPTTCLPETVLFAATRQQVSDVWIAGRPAVAGGKLLSLDEDELLALSRQWAERLRTGQ